MVDVVMLGLPMSRRMHRKAQAQKGCHGNDRHIEALAMEEGDGVSVTDGIGEDARLYESRVFHAPSVD